MAHGQTRCDKSSLLLHGSGPSLNTRALEEPARLLGYTYYNKLMPCSRISPTLLLGKGCLSLPWSLEGPHRHLQQPLAVAAALPGWQQQQ